jgi:bifunctional DNA-binding transcriptional regulator/antitoxin component of YhaV-PrlF toxin-antitoxin module
MATLTVTERGQITFRKEVLRHLGIERGDKIELRMLPAGTVSLRADRPRGKMSDFIGLLAGKTKKVATIEEINQAIADGWAGKRR